MELYYSFSVLIVLASLFAYINLRYLKLPATIGVMLIAIVCSILLRIFGSTFFPQTINAFSTFIATIDFTEVLMGAMLNFLLFAGAIHVNLSDLKEQRAPILTFSTVSVIISAFVVAGIFYWIAPVFNIQLSFTYCLLFGALISPTDPIAVLGILKQAKVPKSLETKIAGESLFNDGVAVVFFVVMLQIAENTSSDLSVLDISWLFVKEVFGGVLLGLALGFTSSGAMRKIDDYIGSVLITLSVVMGGYLVARSLHISGPLTMVAAGLIIGNYGKKTAMSDITKDYLNKFWELIDEILNAILFLFIGFELLLIPDILDHWAFGIAAIGIVLLARTLSIFIPASVIPFGKKFSQGSLYMLIWGGLRGGVSIALVLSMNSGEEKNLFLEITYFVVIFSIVVQGLTVGKLAKRVLLK